MNTRIMFIMAFLISFFLSDCSTTPITYISFYNNTDLEISGKRNNTNENNTEKIIAKYDSFSIASPGNLLLPEYGEEKINKNLLVNGYNDGNLLIKVIIENKEFIISPEKMAYILSKFAVYNNKPRIYYIKITELLEILGIEINSINRIEILTFHP